MTGSEALEHVEKLCGGTWEFHDVWKFIGSRWEENLEAFCHQRITPDEYVKRATDMVYEYRDYQLTKAVEEKLVQIRERK